MTLLMMGSAEALPEEPAVRPMFVEDMTEEQLASAVSNPFSDIFSSSKTNMVIITSHIDVATFSQETGCKAV